MLAAVVAFVLAVAVAAANMDAGSAARAFIAALAALYLVGRFIGIKTW